MRDLPVDARPSGRRRAGYERWDGHGALGYLTLEAIVRAQLADPPERARVVVARDVPDRRARLLGAALADAGLVAALTATSPRRLPSPAGGPPLAGTNPLAIAIPSSDGTPLVADVSMGAVTYGDVLAGRAHGRKSSFRSAASRRTRRSRSRSACSCSSTPRPHDGYGAVLLVARPEADPVPALRALADGLRLPGDRAVLGASQVAAVGCGRARWRRRQRAADGGQRARAPRAAGARGRGARRG